MRKPRKDTIRGRSNGSHDEIYGVDEERESEVLMKRERNPRKRGFLCVLKEDVLGEEVAAKTQFLGFKRQPIYFYLFFYMQ